MVMVKAKEKAWTVGSRRTAAEASGIVRNRAESSGIERNRAVNSCVRRRCWGRSGRVPARRTGTQSAREIHLSADRARHHGPVANASVPGIRVRNRSRAVRA